ncbi:MAG: ParB/RepB/Spo0J family partition protein [Candidatus Brocadiia bacterium]
MVKKRRLGKGLASLIGDADTKKDSGSPPNSSATAASGHSGTLQIELSAIELNPEQPRKELDEEALEGLSESIKSAGVLQPIVVRPKGDLYELVMGERRLKAAHKAGLETIPALVRDISDDRMLELALIENVQREDLNPIEKAEAIDRMIDNLDLTQEQAAQKLGLKRSTVANFLRLLDLPTKIQQMVSRETLSAGHARAVLSLGEPVLQKKLAKKIVDEGLSVRKAERLASQGLSSSRPSRPEPSPQVKRLQRELRDALNTKVEVKHRGKKGKIVVHFANNDEFQRLYDLMRGNRRQKGDREQSAA